MTAVANFKKELHDELTNILEYWNTHTLDHENGGFYGRIDHNEVVIPEADKGIILNTRILWSFSAASNYLGTDQYLPVCQRAFDYIIQHFIDRDYGGVYWELDYQGYPTNTKKQVYAQAFAIYAMAEFHVLTGNTQAKNTALNLFEKIEAHSKSTRDGAYTEALDQSWHPISDMRLSHKDINVSRTMNTHLHVLEAYTSLAKIDERDEVKKALKDLINLINTKFLSEKNQYRLFFDDDWTLQSHAVSYGHDIETAWLVIKAAEAINCPELVQETKRKAVDIVEAFLNEALDQEGAVINEKDAKTGKLDLDRHWWPQVEAMIGLCYTHNITGDDNHLTIAMNIWEFVKKSIIDHEHGEWFFRVDKNGRPYPEDKVSMWKAPYHTSRACITINEIL